MDKWIPAFRMLGIGFYIAFCIVGGILAGWWLGDKRPLFVIIGLVVGLVMAFYGTYSMVKPLLDGKNRQQGKRNG